MAPPGLELLFNSVQNSIKSKQDALICCFHSCLLSNGYKCIGVGEEVPKTIKKTEVLPKGWNDNTNFYSLLYMYENETYLLKCVVVEDTVLVHLMRLSDSAVFSIDIAVNDFITDDYQNYETVYKDVETLALLFQSGLADKFSTKQKKATTSPKTKRKTQSDPDPLRIPHRGQRGRLDPEWGEPSNPFAIGRGDLDPLRAGMGGMVMDPFRGNGPLSNPDRGAGMPGRIPPGSIPPGARFDPFGPLNPDGRGRGRSGPDPDHLPPPGYDDMFM